MNRLVPALVAAFVVVVIALWVRHHRAQEQRNAHLADALATARAKEARRIEAMKEAAAKPMPAEPRACPVKARVRIVRLASIDARGGNLHDVIAAIAEQREPSPLAYELDVADGRAFLFEYASERVVCVGLDAEDPHGTLVAAGPPR